MKCNKCGYEYDTKGKFCMMCGANLEDNSENKELVIHKLAYVVKKNEMIDEDLVDITSNSQIEELLNYTCDTINNNMYFKYHYSDLESIDEYLTNELSKEQLINIIVSIIDSLKDLEEKGIRLNEIYLNTKYILIDTELEKIKMICIPINNRPLDQEINELLKEIILKANVGMEYNNIQKESINYLNLNKDIEIELLKENLIKILKNEVINVEPAIVNEELKEDNSRIITEYYADEFEEMGATTLLTEDESDQYTTVLSEEKEKVYLLRLMTGEKVEINKPLFKIGKNRSKTDYFVVDNSAISRHHADIISKNGEYFIVDVGSTNHTYINGKRICDNVEVALNNEYIIKLADEEFKFLIE